MSLLVRSSFPSGYWRWVLGFPALLLGGCQSLSLSSARREPLRAQEQPVELSRFMGEWYVIAHLPTWFERHAHNAIERYELAEDGTIATTFTFNRGALDGPQKIYRPRGVVHDLDTKAEWRMQFVWPFTASYLIIHVDDRYETTVVGVPGRRYAWIMARTPEISESRYAQLVDVLRQTGHDLGKLRRVPHGRH